METYHRLTYQNRGGNLNTLKKKRKTINDLQITHDNQEKTHDTTAAQRQNFVG